jgi:transposase
LDFILSAIAQNKFEVGNYLIIDNAIVHHGTDTFDIITEALNSVGTKLIFLLAYLPKLNPCELCFSVIKQYIRKRLTSNDIPIWAKVLLAKCHKYYF